MKVDLPNRVEKALFVKKAVTDDGAGIWKPGDSAPAPAVGGIIGREVWEMKFDPIGLGGPGGPLNADPVCFCVIGGPGYGNGCLCVQGGPGKGTGCICVVGGPGNR